VARDSKTTYRPSPEMAGNCDQALAGPPLIPRLASVRVPATTSHRKMSVDPLVSQPVSQVLSPSVSDPNRSLASDAKVTKRPSLEIVASVEAPFAALPSGRQERQVTVPEVRSRR
jgi:hypothetical protein